MSSSRPVRILLVDDDPTIVELLEQIIRHAFPDEVQIKTAIDPKEARRHLEAEVVDLLVTDLEMPGISGVELLRCAKRRNTWTQVLMVTAHSSLDAVTDAMDLGASDYLLKPLNESQLLEAIGKVIQTAA